MQPEIKLYSNNCPNCIIVKTKLKGKGLTFEEVNDMDEIMRLSGELKFSMLPFLQVGSGWYQGRDAIDWVEGV